MAKKKETAPAHVPKRLQARTDNQELYVKTILHNDITFATGPAGSGKTYVATLLGLERLMRGEFERIVLTRPIVGCDEDLGFLPGSAEEKISPFLVPLHDALRDVLSHQELATLKNDRSIEIIPLAYCRGRTFKKTFVVADEMQNATWRQVEMLCTRIGEGTKIVLTGDLSQSDLHPAHRDDFAKFIEKVRGVLGVGIIELQPVDIVRHPIIARLIDALRQSGAV